MSSVQSAFVQLPLSKRFVCTASTQVFTEAALVTALGGFATALGNVYVVDTAAHLTTVFEAFNTGSGVATASSGETLLDMGKEIHVGLAGDESNLLTLRRVQRTHGTVALGYPSGSAVGYVVVENKLSEATGGVTALHPKVSVCRV